MQGSLGNVVLAGPPLLSMDQVWGSNFVGQLAMTATGSFIHLFLIHIIHSFTYFSEEEFEAQKS